MVESMLLCAIYKCRTAKHVLILHPSFRNAVAHQQLLVHVETLWRIYIEATERREEEAREKREGRGLFDELVTPKFCKPSPISPRTRA